MKAGCFASRITSDTAAVFTPASSLGAPNPHRILFVAQDAPQEVIRAAYLALSKVFHPDFGGSADAQIELNEAYEGAMAGARSLK